MATMQQPGPPATTTLRRFYAAVAVGLLAVLPAPVLLPLGAAAAAQRDCSPPPAAAEPIPELPWPQQWFAPERVWPLSQGRDVVVAVVDTGVDASHPQLRDAQVLAGTDLLPEPSGAHVDCASHGTAVASIIAAQQVTGVGFAGLAPQARILPIRASERGSGDTAEPDMAPEALAAAIRWATDHDAAVINLSVVFYRDFPEIAAAVDHASRRGVVLVAAVGPPGTDGEAARPRYPAAYPGVVGVGAFGLDDRQSPTLTSHQGPEVDLLAPGDVVTAAASGGGHLRLEGSSFAAPFVSAAAALLLATDPGLPPAEVRRVLTATGDPGPGTPDGAHPPIVNPYRALTELVADRPPEPVATPLPPAAVDPDAEARAQRWQRAGALAALAAVSAVGLAALGFAAAMVWRRGRRAGWRPARASTPAAGDRPEETEPQRRFFTVPTRRHRS